MKHALCPGREPANRTTPAVCPETAVLIGGYCSQSRAFSQPHHHPIKNSPECEKMSRTALKWAFNKKFFTGIRDPAFRPNTTKSNPNFVSQPWCLGVLVAQVSTNLGHSRPNSSIPEIKFIRTCEPDVRVGSYLHPSAVIGTQKLLRCRRFTVIPRSVGDRISLSPLPILLAKPIQFRITSHHECPTNQSC
jgi:hypothetical protein